MVWTVALVMISGCLSISHFQAWSGPQEFSGQGGAFVTKDGIDIYSAGTPRKKCKVLGIINTTVITKASLMAFFGDSWSTSALVKEAKAKGGNAVILTDHVQQIIGWTTTGMATANQNENSATGYGYSHSSATVSGDLVAVLIKYVGDVQGQVVTQEIEAKILGHWLFVPTPEKQISGQLDISFMPQSRYKRISSLINSNGQSVLPTTEEEGRYYFENNKLVTWGDKDNKPDPPEDIIVTDSQLIFHNAKNKIVFQKVAQ